MSCSVIIPSARSENLIRSVKSLLGAHRDLEPGKIVVVDDGAREMAEACLPQGITWLRGQKPFVWARNINIGIRAVRDPAVVIMGDDVLMATPDAFGHLAECFEEHPQIGAVSPAVRGVVGNPIQQEHRKEGLDLEPSWLAFVCVMISRQAVDVVGLLDEAFKGYGCDDVDYSWRLRRYGYQLGVLHSSVVIHDGSIPSTFRSRGDVSERWEENRLRLAEKWGDAAP